MRTIAVVNQKGGCGKTTTTINLAAALARRGLRTLVVDLDPQSHCATGLAIPEDRIERDIGDAMLVGGAMDPQRLLWRANRNLDVAPSRTKLAGLEAPRGGLHEQPDKDTRLRATLERLALSTGGWDWCVLDCPPSIGLLTYNALAAAGEVLIPVETSYFSLQGAAKQVQTIRSIGRRLSLRHTVRLIGTIHDPESDLARELLAELRRRFGAAVAPMFIHADNAIKEAASFGRAIIDHAPASPAASDYDRLAAWLLDVDDRHAADPSLDPAATEAREPAFVDVLPAATAVLGARRLVTLAEPWEPQHANGTHAPRRESPEMHAASPVAAAPVAVSAGPSAAMTQTHMIASPGLGGFAAVADAPRAEPFQDAEAAQTETMAPLSPDAEDPLTLDLITRPTDPQHRSTVSRVEDLHRRAIALSRRIGEEAAELVVRARHGALALVEPVRRGERPKSVERLFGARCVGRRVLFVQPLDLGRRICVAGTFNNWSPDRHPMRRREALGVHELTIETGPGDFQYRLVIDGRWAADVHNAAAVQNEFGDLNSLIRVLDVAETPRD